MTKLSGIICDVCHEPIEEYWKANCRCGNFIGAPNCRAAEHEKSVLLDRYNEAVNDAESRRVPRDLLEHLERLAEQSQLIIDVNIAVCINLLKGDKYRNYEQRIETGDRSPAQARDHANRAIVGEKLFPNYAGNILYAALSPNGRGTTTYGGDLWMRWVVNFPFTRWVSLLEENSFMFFEQHNLGSLHIETPSGYRSVWEDRAKLVIAKLGPHLSSATSKDALEDMILHSADAKVDDRFIEIHVYAEGGLDSRDIDLVTFQHHAIPGQEEKWQRVRDMCNMRNITVEG